MPIIVGLCGHSGVGKTTALNYLVDTVCARGVYLGACVLEEVRRLKLEETRENERLVRVALRKDNRAEMVVRGIPSIEEALGAASVVVLDAILLPEELDFLKAALPDIDIHLVEMHASLDVRTARLGIRPDRPLIAADIQARDQLEVSDFRLDLVFETASYGICNDGSINDLYLALDEFVAVIGLRRSGD